MLWVDLLRRSGFRRYGTGDDLGSAVRGDQRSAVVSLDSYDWPYPAQDFLPVNSLGPHQFGYLVALTPLSP